MFLLLLVSSLVTLLQGRVNVQQFFFQKFIFQKLAFPQTFFF